LLKNKKKLIRVHLKYGPNRERVINEIKRVSKPGRRIYVGKDEIPLVKAGLGVAILSTNKGIIPGYKARKLGVGGEVLCYVW
jgi:small subunit ribosomal protein S8